MSPRLPVLLTAVAAAASLGFAAPAGAATVTTPNACTAGDGQYGNLPLKLDAAASTADRTLNLGSTQPSVDEPAWLKAKLQPYAFLLGAGTQTFKIDAWIALAGEGSTDAPQLRSTSGTVKITVAFANFAFTVTKIELALAPLDATTWHSPGAGGTVTVKQAGPGSLPEVPGGSGGAMVQPAGSLFIHGSNGSIDLTVDCQPGSNGSTPDSLTPTLLPGAATALASGTFGPLGGEPAPTPTPTPAPTPEPTPAPSPEPTPAATPAPTGGSAPAQAGSAGPAPARTATPTPKPLTLISATLPTGGGPASIVSSALKLGSSATLVKVACEADGPACSGKIYVKTAKKVSTGKRGKAAKKARRRLAAGKYSLAPGETAAVKLKLSKDGKKLRKQKLVALVTVKPASGKAVTKRVRVGK